MWNAVVALLMSVFILMLQYIEFNVFADKGLILHPTKFNESLTIDVYADAAFACAWSEELGTNPDSVKSRTGYIIEVMSCPVLWVARLQISIAISTME